MMFKFALLASSAEMAVPQIDSRCAYFDASIMAVIVLSIKYTTETSS